MRYGFGPRYFVRLRDGRDALLAHETGRSQTAAARKVISQSNVTVEQKARDARFRPGPENQALRNFPRSSAGY